MAGQSNAAPVIIKRKKVIQGGGHHGGAWKVAYADFVTAMMAFFMLMWLLNATTEKQRKGIADYFNPTIPVNRISGGGDGAFGGDSVFSEQTLAQSGTGASDQQPTVANMASGAADAAAHQAATTGDKVDGLADVEQALRARGGESMTMQQALRHVTTRVTDEGLVIELFDLPDAPLFLDVTAQPADVTHDLVDVLAEVLVIAQNDMAMNGYVATQPIVLINNSVWQLSSERAQVFREMLEQAGLPADRMRRVTGFADRVPATSDPLAIRNNRLEVVLLRNDR
jgi:chemotaxis protein MotB